MADLGAIGKALNYSIPSIGLETVNIGGQVLESAIPVAGALVTLLFERRYGSAKTFVAPSSTFVPPVPEVIRNVVTNADGQFLFNAVKADEEYIVIAYNPNRDTPNQRAVGAFLVAATQSLELDFAVQDTVAWRMFFLL